MSLSLDGKSALVTGGSRGIGRAIAERLTADGAAVIINYTRNSPSAQAAANIIIAKGGKTFAAPGGNFRQRGWPGPSRSAPQRPS